MGCSCGRVGCHHASAVAPTTSRGAPAGGFAGGQRRGNVRRSAGPRAVGVRLASGASRHRGASRAESRVQGVGGAVRSRRARGIRRPCRGAGTRLRHRLRPLPAVAARGWPRPELARLARLGRGPHRARHARHLGPHADLPLQPGGHRADLRHPGLPGPGADHARDRHRRGAQRGGRRLGARRRVAGVQGAVRPDARGRPDHPRAVDRAQRDLRRRVLQHGRGQDLRPPRRAGPDLRRRGRADGGPLCRPDGRRLHLHLGQGPAAVCRPAGSRGRRGARAGRPRPRRDRPDDRGQALVGSRPRPGAGELPLLGAAVTHPPT